MKDALHLAAELSNPWRAGPLPEMNEAMYDHVTRILLGNNVSMMSLEHQLSPNGDFLWRRRHAEERATYDTFRREFERIRLDFDAHGIDTLLFKATGLYPSFPHLSSNLDVLVRRGQSDLARRRLWKLGYLELVNVEEPDKYLFRRFPPGGQRFTFHLHEAVGWGVPFVDLDRMWEGAEAAPDDPGVVIPAPREALLVTLAHWFYEDKTLTLQNLYLTADALRKLGGGIDDAAAQAVERGWGEGFYLSLKVFHDAWQLLFGEPLLDGDVRREADRRVDGAGSAVRWIATGVRYGGEYPATIPFLRNKVIYYRKVLRDPKRRPSQRWRDTLKTLLWAVRWKLHIRSQRPLLVTLSGCDGSGKTVQSEHLDTVLGVCDIRVKTVWARGASSRSMSAAIKLAKRVFGRGRSDGRPDSGVLGSATSPDGATLTEAEKMNARRSYVRNPVLRFLFAKLFGLDMAMVYAVKVRWYLFRGFVVVCDRYVEDFLVDFAQYTGTSATRPPLPLRIMAALCPTPDHAFYLDVSEAEALRRKPEEGDVAHLATAREMLRQLADQRGMTVIDERMDVGAVHERIVTDVLTTFYKRYRTLGNWLLASNPSQLNPGRWRIEQGDPE